jgi:CRISPR-associated protein Cas5t
MRFVLIPLRSVTASYRNPEFQNFHKSFPLPPPTTLIGLAGAALGLSPKAAQDFFDETPFRAGVCGTSAGMTTDLWKYDTFGGRSIIKRELFFQNRLWVVFGSENEATVEQIHTAFRSPRYALTLGASDSLVCVDSPRIHLTEEVQSQTSAANALAEGDLVQHVLDQAIATGGSFSLNLSTADPVAYPLPVRFQYESDYGIRRVVKRKVFSFIGPRLQFDGLALEGVTAEDGTFIPLFDL